MPSPGDNLPPLVLTAPLSRDDNGVVRIGDTRVRLDSVVYAFLAGATPEAIAEQFPALNLSEVYAAVTFYLQQRQAVDDYLRRQEEAGALAREEVEAAPGHSAWRERLRSRMTGPRSDAAAAG